MSINDPNIISALIGASTAIAVLVITHLLGISKNNKEVLKEKIEILFNDLVILSRLSQKKYDAVLDYEYFEEGSLSEIHELIREALEKSTKIQMYINLYFPVMKKHHREVWKIINEIDKIIYKFTDTNIEVGNIKKPHKELLSKIGKMEQELISYI